MPESLPRPGVGSKILANRLKRLHDILKIILKIVIRIKIVALIYYYLTAALLMSQKFSLCSNMCILYVISCMENLL